MDMKNICLALGLLLVLGIGTTFATDTGTTGVSLTLGNTAPTVTSVSTPSAQDPTSCTTTAIPTIYVNVTDPDGWADISAGATYVNISKGAVTHQTASCVVDSHDGNWAYFNCTGAVMNFYDVTGSDWAITAHTADVAGSPDDLVGSPMTYNEGTHMIVQNAPITFGTVYAGTNDNANTNAPALNVKNCGNTVQNMTVQGANITDGGSNIMAVGQFRIGDGVQSNLTLSESAQVFSKTGGLGIGASSTWDLFSYVNVPVAQPQALYNTGVWTLVVSKA